MGAAAGEAHALVSSLEPVDDAERGHRAAPFGSNDRSGARFDPPRRQGGGEIVVKRDRASALFLGRPVAQFDRCRYLATRVEHHIPCELGDFAGAQAGFHRQKNDDAIAEGISGLTGVGEELDQLLVVENFCLLACHLTLDVESLNLQQLVVNERMRAKSEKVWRRSATALMSKS